jgi:hypothetical protein
MKQKNTLFAKACRWGGLDLGKYTTEEKHNIGRIMKHNATQGRMDTDSPYNLKKEDLGKFFRACSYLWSVQMEKRRVIREQLPVMKREMNIGQLLSIDSHKGEFVGVEIEFMMPRNISASVLKTRFVELGSDGSIDPISGFFGLEARLVYVRGVSENRLENYCQKLAGVGAVVNKSCGLHVHLDQRNVSRATAWRRYHRLVTALEWLKFAVPSTRTSNSYCKLNREGENPENYDRYMAVNWQAYAEHGTIEVRLLNGTTSADKIKHWVSLCIGATRNTLETMDDMLKCNDIPAEAKEWYLARRRKFHGDIGNGMNSEGSEV